MRPFYKVRCGTRDVVGNIYHSLECAHLDCVGPVNCGWGFFVPEWRGVLWQLVGGGRSEAS
jgi:hypothetical protein